MAPSAYESFRIRNASIGYLQLCGKRTFSFRNTHPTASKQRDWRPKIRRKKNHALYADFSALP
jgi:hypothetical protein